ncbi:MAG TPA: TMEM165/GDT1 family protein [Polyangia bacterium]|nr:TMEM165/GDT1 family protein [Polyangia bacterium]
MDWKLLATAFGSVFIAELGDKTQLATLALATGKHSRLMVFAGAAAALVCTSLIAVVAGGVIGRYVPESYLRRIAGGVFIALGLLYILRPG